MRISAVASIGTRFLLLVYCAALLASACRGDGAQVPEPKQQVNRDLWERAWTMAVGSQRDALKDGELTFAEYEAAALRTAQCISAFGAMRGEAVLDPVAHSYAVGARWTSNGDAETDRKLTKESDDCYQENWNGINQAWSAMNHPSETELNEARAALASCLREAGVEISSFPSVNELQSFRTEPSYFGCAKKVQEQFGIPYFGG
jgi:hypothetical protein